MEQDTFLKIIGIIVIIAMIGSILAAGFLYAPTDQGTATPSLADQQTNKSSFDYDVSFDTNIIDDLTSIRIAAQTSLLDKPKIDLTIQKLDSVTKVRTSEFRPAESGAIYFAEIDIKKSANISETANLILDLNFFNGTKQAVKKVSINTPKEDLDVYNSDLNITRKFNFDYPTTFALADLSSIPGDTITVNGTVKLSGKDILFLELIENNNLTNTPEMFSVKENMPLVSVSDEFFFEAKVDSNDINYQEIVMAKDSNANVFVFDNSIMGQTTMNIIDLENIFVDVNLDVKKMGQIYVESLFVNDLNKNIEFNQPYDIELTKDTTMGNIDVDFLVSVSRDSTQILQVVQE